VQCVCEVPRNLPYSLCTECLVLSEGAVSAHASHPPNLLLQKTPPDDVNPAPPTSDGLAPVTMSRAIAVSEAAKTREPPSPSPMPPPLMGLPPDNVAPPSEHSPPVFAAFAKHVPRESSRVTPASRRDQYVGIVRFIVCFPATFSLKGGTQAPGTADVTVWQSIVAVQQRCQMSP